MIKFFRKYNKQLLAVLVIFLMVVFVGGSAFTILISPGPGSQTLGTAFGHELTGEDRAIFSAQTNILSRLSFPWNRPWMDRYTRRDPGLQPLGLTEYMLLVKEALRGGATPDTVRAGQVLQQLAVDLDRFRLEYRVSADHLESSVANYLMIQDLWSTASQSVQASELEIRQAVREQYQTLNASIVAIDSGQLVDEETEIPQAELLAHFDTYKNNPRGAAPLDFGYRIPDRLQVQYIKIDTATIKPPSDVSLKQAQAYWEENKKLFLRPLEEEPPQDVPAEEPPAEESAGDGSAEGAEEGEAVVEEAPAEQAAPDDDDPQEKSLYYDTFAEAREDVFAELRKERQLDEARQVAEALIGRLRDPWYDQAIADDGYPTRPADVDGVDYLDKMARDLGNAVRQTESISVAETELFAITDTAAVELLGGAREDVGSGYGSRTFGDIVGQVQGLFPRSVEAESTEFSALALFETSPNALIDNDNNLYVYRIVQVDPAHPPTTIAEVHDEVVADVRLARAKARAIQHAEAISALAGDGTLQEAWDAYGDFEAEKKDTVASMFTASPFSKQKFLHLGYGQAIPIPNNVLDAGGNAHNRIQSNEFVDQAFALLQTSGANALDVIDVPGLQKAFAVQVIGLNPVTLDNYAQLKLQVRRSLNSDRVQALKREWFSRENIRARAGFVADG